MREFGGPTVLVTHDPLEALVLADRLVVLEHGEIVQEGRPPDLRAQPRSEYVAGVVGINLLRGQAEQGSVDVSGLVLSVPGAERGDVLVAIHPRSVALHNSRPEGTPRNVWMATISSIDDEGERLRVVTDGDVEVAAEITPAARSELGLAVGSVVWVSVKATEIVTYPA